MAGNNERKAAIVFIDRNNSSSAADVDGTANHYCAQARGSSEHTSNSDENRHARTHTQHTGTQQHTTHVFTDNLQLRHIRWHIRRHHGTLVDSDEHVADARRR